MYNRLHPSKGWTPSKPKETFTEIKTSSGGVLRSPDYNGKLSVGKVLTDNKIVHYLLAGKYGMEKREDMLKEIEKNPKRFGRFIKKIRSGEYGTDIQDRFGKAKITTKKGKRRTVSNMTANELMDELFNI
jgi:hypothetical protein